MIYTGCLSNNYMVPRCLSIYFPLLRWQGRGEGWGLEKENENERAQIWACGSCWVGKQLVGCHFTRDYNIWMCIAKILGLKWEWHGYYNVSGLWWKDQAYPFNQPCLDRCLLRDALCWALEGQRTGAGATVPIPFYSKSVISWTWVFVFFIQNWKYPSKEYALGVGVKTLLWCPLHIPFQRLGLGTRLPLPFHFLPNGHPGRQQVVGSATQVGDSKGAPHSGFRKTPATPVVAGIFFSRGGGCWWGGETQQ